MFPFLPIIASLLAGGVLGYHTRVEPGIAFLGALFSHAAWWFSPRRSRATILLLAALIWLGMLWQDLCWNRFLDREIGRFASETAHPVCLDVVSRSDAVNLPQEPNVHAAFAADTTWQFSADAHRLRDGDIWHTTKGRVVVVVHGELGAIPPGSHLRIVGLLRREAAARNPGEVSRSDVARSTRRLCRLTCGHGHAVVRLRMPMRNHLIDRFRTTSSEILRRRLGDSESKLAWAILLGMRSSLEQSRKRFFFETGTSHFLAISGLHVGILASAFWLAARLRLLSPRFALGLAMVMSAFYIVLTGSRAPVIRASFFVWSACLGYLLKRRLVAWNFLAAAGTVVFAINASEPFQVGTQLSFLAVGAIVGFAALPDSKANAPFDRLIEGSRPLPIRWMRQAAWKTWLVFRLSLIIWLVTLPLVMSRFHLFTPIAPGLNVVLWIPVCVALFSGFAVITLGWIMPPLASVAAIPCRCSLQFMEWTVQQAHQWPFSHWWVAGWEPWTMAGCYACIFVLASSRLSRYRLAMLIAITVSWWGVGQLTPATPMTASDWRAPSNSLQCTALAVGHGGCAVLQLPDGRVIVYDAGGLGHPSFNVDLISRYLWYCRIRKIDKLVLSHPDIDHYNAMPGLAKRFRIGTIYVSRQMFTTMNDSLRELAVTIRYHRIPVMTVEAGNMLASGSDWHIQVLHPPTDHFEGSDNAWSIVLNVERGSRRILMTGDVEDAGLDRLLCRSYSTCDVLFAPHHGSPQCRPSELLVRFQPEFVVISDGNSPSIEQQCEAYAISGAKVFHTARDGAVRITIQADLSVESWQQATVGGHTAIPAVDRGER